MSACKFNKKYVLRENAKKHSLVHPLYGKIFLWRPCSEQNAFVGYVPCVLADWLRALLARITSRPAMQSDNSSCRLLNMMLTNTPLASWLADYPRSRNADSFYKFTAEISNFCFFFIIISFIVLTCNFAILMCCSFFLFIANAVWLLRNKGLLSYLVMEKPC